MTNRSSGFPPAPVDDAASARVEEEMVRGSRLLDEHSYEEAEAAYLSADLLLANERSPRHAEVLMCLAQIARATNRSADAVKLLDHALATFPGHRAALAQRIDLARGSEDHATAAALGRRVLGFAESDDARVRVLSEIVEDSLSAAVEAIRTALQLRRGDRPLLERLRAVHEASGQFTEAVNVGVALAESNPVPIERARAFVTAADLCATKANNVDRAVALYEAAIADDPAVAGAFEAIEQVLLDSGDVEGTEKAYVRQLERLRGRGVEASEAALLSKLAGIREDRLADWQGAVQALDQLVTLRPNDLAARARMAELLEQNGEDGFAIRCLEVNAQRAPSHVPTFRALNRIFARKNELDRAYTACGVLVHFGEADLDEQATYRKYAPLVAQQANRAIDESAWAMLQPEGHDAVVSAIVSSIAPAAVAFRVEQLKARKMLPKLESRERQDLEKTTVSAVRTVGWAAKLLGMRPPEVHARPGDASSGITIVPAVEATMLLGDAVLTGRSVPELTFLFGYELAYQRAADRMLALFPSIAELRALVVAAIGLVVPSPGLPPDVANVQAGIGAKLDAVQKYKLQGAVKALTERGGQLDLLGWLRSLERTACRVGLLACGDITVAARLLAVDGRVIGGLTAADRVKDLIPFSVSETYAKLRKAIGVAVV